MAGIGFFAPLPLAMMMPFMAGQSMMMGDAFGKSYQYGKRKISAMSNEDFNKLTVKDLANDIQADFNNIIPPLSQAVRQSSAFQSLIIQEMGKIIKSLPAELTQFFTGEPGTGTNIDSFAQLASALLKLMSGGGFTVPTLLPAEGAEDFTIPPPITIPSEPEGPPAPPLTQQQLLDKYANWKTYRQKGGLLTEQQWRVARRGQTGGIPITPPRTTIPKDESGKTFHPAFFRQIKSLTNNRLALLKQLSTIQKFIADKTRTLATLIKNRRQSGSSRNNSLINSITREIQQKQRDVITLTNQVSVIQVAIDRFNNKFTPFK